MNGLSTSKDGLPLPRRAAIYVRVSSEEQVQGYSLDAQERASRMYCEMHGWGIVHLYRDEGRSARTEQIAKRPAFAQMLEDAETARFDVVIVHKLDRFARNLVVTIETLQRLERAGVSFVSISEQMDFSTPIGRMTLSMLASLAQYYSDNLSWETKKGKAERKRQGLYNGLLPYGVMANAAGIPVIDMTPWACNRETRQELTPAHGLRMAFVSRLSDGPTRKSLKRSTWSDIEPAEIVARIRLRRTPSERFCGTVSILGNSRTETGDGCRANTAH